VSGGSVNAGGFVQWLPGAAIALVVPALVGCSIQFSAGEDAERNAYRAQMLAELSAYGEVNAGTRNGTCQSDVLSAGCEATLTRYCDAVRTFREGVVAIKPPQEYNTQHQSVVRTLESLVATCTSARAGFDRESTTQVQAALDNFPALHEEFRAPMVAIGAVSE